MNKAKIKKGYFGEFGGQFVAETLIPALNELEEAYETIAQGADFKNEFQAIAQDYIGRATPLTYAKNLSESLGKARIFLKREDLCHTGAHKVNNTLGQCLLAKKMGKTRVIAETGAGQHGVATATLCALLGLKCEVYMGYEDVQRQALNVQRMKLLGAKVIPVYSGSQTLKDALNEALRDWVTNVRDTFYCIGTVAGPHPYPIMVRDFQSIIGYEVMEQLEEHDIKAPTHLVACIGGGSNAMGLFAPFIEQKSVKLIGVEAAGAGVNTKHHAASLTAGSKGILHGNLTYLVQDKAGQILPTHSISAGLDYPGVGPEHAWLHDTGRAEYVTVTDKQALAGFELLSAKEGIIPALESAHAIGYLPKLCSKLTKNDVVVVNLSGRGDKDMDTVMKHLK